MIQIATRGRNGWDGKVQGPETTPLTSILTLKVEEMIRMHINDNIETIRNDVNT